MHNRYRRTTIPVAAAVLALSVGAAADGQRSNRDAEIFKQKVAAITAFGDGPLKQGHRTPVTEQELNAYLAYEVGPQLPMGVVDPSVTILGSGRFSARAVVDLDAVRREKNPTSLLDPAYYLTGRLPVTATGVLKTSNGVGRFQLESATLGGVPIPKIVLQEIVSHYSRTPETPEGIGFDDPFQLPARIREIEVQRGRAVIVQ